MKKIIALIMVIATIFSVMSISAYAEDAGTVTVTVDGVDFVFEADTSEEFRNEFIADYFGNDDSAAVYGLTCTLFGHDIETSIVTTVTHKERATAPRCFEKTYEVENCTRCDYSNSVLIYSRYISCC